MEGIAERIPVYAQLHDFARKECGAGTKAFYTDPELLVVNTLKTLNRWHIDYPTVDYDVYNIEAEALGQKIVYSRGQNPVADRTRPLIRNHRDLDKINTPDFSTEGRFPFVIRICSLFHELTGLQPDLNFCAPFTMAATIRGVEPLLMDFYEDPVFARDLLDRITEMVLIPWIQYMARLFPEARGICGSDALSSLPIVNMDILECWSTPYILRLRETCGDKVYVPNWVGEHHLSSPEEMFDLKLKVCPRFLQGQDPDVAAIGPEVYTDYAERRGVPLILGIGSSFLAQSPEKEVADRVKRYLRAGGRNGQFCIYFCNIDSATPVENLKSALRTIRQYGNLSDAEQ